MSGEQRDRRFERAHGGIIHRDGTTATLGDGSQAHLTGTPHSLAAADNAIARTARRVRNAN